MVNNNDFVATGSNNSLSPVSPLVTDFQMSTFVIRLQQFRLRRLSISQLEHIFDRWLTSLPVYCILMNPVGLCDHCGLCLEFLREHNSDSVCLLAAKCGHYICSNCLRLKQQFFTHLGLSLCCNLCEQSWLQNPSHV